MVLTRRRAFLEEGESLLLCRSTLGTVVRFREFVDQSGVPEHRVLSSPLNACPLPLYTDFGDRRRWEGTRADFMWHPLMWLPPRLAGRYNIKDAHGNTSVEDDDLWALRLVLELSTSGLYDVGSGTWFDVLSAVDIDVATAEGLQRVQMWLDGATDADLDSLDLAEYLDVEPHSWALEAALDVRPLVEEASWALIASDLLEVVDSAVAHIGDDRRHHELLTGASSITSLGAHLLTNVPNPSEPTTQFFDRLHSRLGLDGVPASVDEVGAVYLELQDQLREIAQVYAPALNELEQVLSEDDQ